MLLTIPPRFAPNTFVGFPFCTELDNLKADVAILGIPYGDPYSMDEVTNDQTNAPSANCLLLSDQWFFQRSRQRAGRFLMKGVDYMTVAPTAMDQIKKGAFLTVKSGDSLNTMTIGWATIGHVWRKPIIMVAVRLSRHTFGIIETAEDFTVSIPSSDMKKELMFCGTKSGRDYDKFKECDLQPLDSQKVITPIIKVSGVHYEGKIVYKSAMDPAFLNADYDTALYPEKDYHTLYFGEIVDCYEID